MSCGRLCAPAPEYAEAFRPALRLLTMAALGGQLLSITVSIDYPQALAAMLKVRLSYCSGRLGSEAHHLTDDPIAGEVL